MVIGLLSIAAIPTVTGVGQAISVQKKQNAADKEKEKFHLTATFDIEGKAHETTFCVLKSGRLLVNRPGDVQVIGHQFCGYYFNYPSEEQHLGLVSTISDDPPMLSWVFVNKDTHAVEYGGRKDTIGHIIGPWGWSDDECFLTLEGDHESFIAKCENDGDGDGDGDRDGEPRWLVYWDPGHKMLAAESTGHCMALRLRRRLLLGVESRYVRGKDA